MVRVISPEVNFLSYGPVVKLKDNEGKETVLTPDDLVYAASGVTFKGMKFINEVIDIAITSGSAFSQLNLAIDAFKNAISHE